jgi:hypothetical protein
VSLAEGFVVAPFKAADQIDLFGGRLGQRDGRFGQRDDPCVLPSVSSELAVLAVLRNLAQWEGRIGSSWRVAGWDLATEVGGNIHRVRIDRRFFTEAQVIPYSVAFYFDFSAVENSEPPPFSPLVCRFGSLLGFPQDLAWLHFQRVIVNTQAGEAFDVTLQYKGARGYAGIYIYGQCEPGDAGAVERQGRATIATALELAAKQSPTAPWPPGWRAAFYGQSFLVGDSLSFAGVAERGGKFIKLRLTMKDEDLQSREMNGECMGAISSSLDRKLATWTKGPSS